MNNSTDQLGTCIANGTDNSCDPSQTDTEHVELNSDKCTYISNATYNNEEEESHTVENSEAQLGVKISNMNSLETEHSNDFNQSEEVNELRNVAQMQQKKIDEYESQLQQLEHKSQDITLMVKELETKLQTATKQKDIAIKDKEVMVMRYAVSEKSVMDQKAGRELAEKRLQEALKENDLLQHKLNTMVSEKNRICSLFDGKCYELKTVRQELERKKQDLSALETKLKWSQNSLKIEMELHKESAAKVETLNARVQEATNEIEKTKREAQESIKTFHVSQQNRAHVLDQQLKEQQAILILEKHEKDEKEQQNSIFKKKLEQLQAKHQALIQENNSLSLKVQQLEIERLENEQKLSELRNTADQLRQDEANMNCLSATLEQLKLQLAHEQEQREANSQQLAHLKQRNSELEVDMDSCRVREADMLLFTQQLTDKNVRLQSEFSALETKVQQLTCEQTLLKRNIKEYETRSRILSEQLEKERSLRNEENQMLARHLAEKTKLCEQLAQQLEDQKGENLVIKRKLELSQKEIMKELQQSRKRLEQYEKADMSTNSRSSSSSSLNVAEAQSSSSSPVNNTIAEEPAPDHQVIQPENVLDKQTLIDHIIKLQRTSAKKSEKLDFLEEHVQTLLMELQRKTRLLQSYIIREQSGILSSNKMDENKAALANSNTIMASVYGSKVTDHTLTLELSLDINRKLQAVLEDALLKNITLKENVDTLGAEIERLHKQRCAP